MSIELVRALRHMAWSNQQVYKSVAALPDEALGSYIVNPDWTAGNILEHICSGATWYVFRLEIEDWVDIPKIEKSSDVLVVANLLADLDSKLVLAAENEDRELEYRIEEENRIVRRWYSSILTQAVHHATEHRAQLIDALEFKGYKPINLDDLDLWRFDEVERG